MSGNLGCVTVAVDDSEESMNALRWALDNLKLKSPAESDSDDGGSFVILHVKVKTLVVIGDPKDKLCEAVENLHADLLVMGSRSFGPIEEHFPAHGLLGRLIIQMSRARLAYGFSWPLVNQLVTFSQGYFWAVLMNDIEMLIGRGTVDGAVDDVAHFVLSMQFSYSGQQRP
ncbi:hypothetical protein L1049_026571 [Liquidambar formosana]|uniref:UspA domain-containing protein n=1 Tax=Liquidambar formosana TaxID=63359 RepID=A0AAP0NDY8_LIQFO